MIMGFWIFMTCCNLLIPALMLIFGRLMLHHPPKSINMAYGYRTKRSMQNQETWDFAQAACGRLWQRAGCIMLPLSLLAMLPVMGKSSGAIGSYGAVTATLECMVLIFSILPVERALKKKFGNSKKETQ